MNRIEKLLLLNLKHKATKEEIKKILKEEGIPVKKYNEFILGVLTKKKSTSATLNLDEFLDDNFLKSLYSEKRKEVICRKTLFEEFRQPSKFYASPNFRSYRMARRMLSVEELHNKLGEFSYELGLKRKNKKECALYLKRGLEMFMKDVLDSCNEDFSVEVLKRMVGKKLGMLSVYDV